MKCKTSNCIPSGLRINRSRYIYGKFTNYAINEAEVSILKARIKDTRLAIKDKELIREQLLKTIQDSSQPTHFHKFKEAMTRAYERELEKTKVNQKKNMKAFKNLFKPQKKKTQHIYNKTTSSS